MSSCLQHILADSEALSCTEINVMPLSKCEFDGKIGFCKSLNVVPSGGVVDEEGCAGIEQGKAILELMAEAANLATPLILSTPHPPLHLPGGLELALEPNIVERVGMRADTNRRHTYFWPDVDFKFTQAEVSGLVRYSGLCAISNDVRVKRSERKTPPDTPNALSSTQFNSAKVKDDDPLASNCDLRELTDFGFDAPIGQGRKSTCLIQMS